MEHLLVPLSDEQENEILHGMSYSRIELRRDLAMLRGWIAEQSHLPPSASTEPEAFYCNFLVGCKGDIDKAKTKIANYYKFRSWASDLCGQRDPLDPKLVDLKPHFHIFTLPKATADGGRVTASLSLTPDYPGYDPALIVKRMILIMEMRLRTEVVHGGEYLIMDNKNYSTAYFFALRPNFIRGVIHFIQNVMPFRIKGIVSLNTPSFLHAAINSMIKPLLKRKIAKRWHVYTGGCEILIEHFTLDLLPREFGGQGESIQTLSDRWMDHAATPRWREWFLKDGSETVREEMEPRGALSFKNFWSSSTS